MLDFFRKKNAILTPLKYFKKNFNKKGIRIDYVKNGSMLLGVNKQVDVTEITKVIPTNNEDGIYLMLYFREGRLSNDENLSKFKKSSYYEKFQCYPINDTLVFVMQKESVDLESLEYEIANILKDIYNITSKTEIEYYVRQ